jgi:hypothetical protein
MDRELKQRPETFPFRMELPLRNAAKYLAQLDGISLNHFIVLAVAERISRFESEMLKEHTAVGERRPSQVLEFDDSLRGLGRKTTSFEPD